MLSSPAKRRKTSPAAAVAVDASETTQRPLNGNSRPASFQSPTRASLARSHHDVPSRVLSRSPTRSPQRPASKGSQSGQNQQTEERVFGLRDRKALRPSLTLSGSPFKGPRLSGGLHALSSRRRSSGIPAFAAPPRRVSRKIRPSDLVPGAPKVPESNASPRAHANTPDDQLTSELGAATRETEADWVLEPPVLEEEYGEPDLPPTPTELGLEKAPERPKGLLSSSPSSRREKRRRRRAREEFKSSPLRPGGGQTTRVGETLSMARPTSDQDEVPDAVRKRQTLKDELSAQLQQLKHEVSQLEHWAQRSERPDDFPEPDEEAISKLISLLTTRNPSCAPLEPASPGPPSLSSLISSLLPFSRKVLPKATRQASSAPTNPFVLQETAGSKPYLAIFAPLSLTKHSTTVTSDSDSLYELHDLTLSAPFPFLQDIYRVPIAFKTNPETQSILSISVPMGASAQSAGIPPPLGRWMSSRLANPLLKLDISGLCWGVCRYWEAAICRARVWAKLQRKYSMLAGLGVLPDEEPYVDDTSVAGKSGFLTKSDFRLLAPHLERTTMLFSSGRREEPKLILSCILTLDDWTSEPQLNPEISVSGPGGRAFGGAKVEREAKKLFRGLLKRGGKEDVVRDVDIDAIVQATEGVMGVLFGIDIISKTGGKGSRNN